MLNTSRNFVGISNFYQVVDRSHADGMRLFYRFVNGYLTALTILPHAILKAA